jgi:hypothetical protein
VVAWLSCRPEPRLIARAVMHSTADAGTAHGACNAKTPMRREPAGDVLPPPSVLPSQPLRPIFSGDSCGHRGGQFEGHPEGRPMAEHIYSRDLSERHTIAGLFPDRASAEQAIDALKAAGFTGDQIGVAMRDRTAQGILIEETGTEAAEGAATGALGGGMLGGLAGFLIGIGALAIPGVGPIVAGGILAEALGVAGGTALAGAGIGAAAGGLVGALVGVGIPEPAARHFETGFRAGRVLVTVEAGARVLEAMAILDRHGADTGPASGPGAIGS